MGRWYLPRKQRRGLCHHAPMRLDGVISAVDAHAGGEPGRVIVGGVS